MVVYRCAPHLKRIFVASESKSGWGVGVAAFAWVDDEGVVEGKKAERWGKGEKERKTGGGGGGGLFYASIQYISGSFVMTGLRFKAMVYTYK